MVKMPQEIINYVKNAADTKNRILDQVCKKCNKTLREGGYSGTARVCASCLRGE